MSTPIIHLIGNAHIDPVWLWPWQEGYAEVKATFRSALDRMEEFPDFVFTCSGAVYYRWVQESDPAMFAEIQRRVTEGRWRVVGGWWIQPDCNIPGGESFARHALLSQRYFRDHLGVTATVGYNVDSFGHNAMLPQIYRHSGMDAYVMMRPEKHEMELPANLFLWQSPDGSRVTTYRIQGNYASWWGDPDPVLDKVAAARALGQEQGTDVMCFYGVGNHGGGPTIRSVRAILGAMAQPNGDALCFSTPRDYFDSVAGRYDLPVVTTDLQHHASGCYAAHSAVKALNRKAEHRLTAAEACCVLGGALAGGEYPRQALNTAWEKVLFNQFHDIMGGCGVPAIYEDARDAYGQALTLAAEVENGALQRIAWAIDTSSGQSFPLSRDGDWTTWQMGERGVPIAVFNSLAWPVCAPVRVNRKMARLTDDAGAEVAHQCARAGRTDGEDQWDTLWLAELPALGYRVYWGWPDPVKRHEPRIAPATVLENDRLRAVFDGESGSIRSLVLKEYNVELAAAGLARAVVIDEDGVDTWAHAVNYFDRELGCFGDADLRLIESGPVRQVLRVTTRWGDSMLRQDFALYAGSDELQVEVRLDWREPRKQLKLCFDTAIANDTGDYSIPYGHITRPADGEEEPGHAWVSIAGPLGGVGEFGLSMINDSKYSYAVLPGVLRMTAVRSPIFAQYNSTPDELSEPMDIGPQQFRYALAPHKGGWRAAGIPRRAAAFNTPPFRLTGTYHAGPLPLAYQGIAVSADNVLVTALKRAEDGTGTVLRCHETDGKAARVHFDLHCLNRCFDAEIAPYAIRTYLIPDDGTSVREVNFIEWENAYDVP